MAVTLTECEKEQNSVLLRQISSTVEFKGVRNTIIYSNQPRSRMTSRRVDQPITTARPAQAIPRNVMFCTEYVAMVWSWTLSTVRMQTTSNVSKAGCLRYQAEEKSTRFNDSRKMFNLNGCYELWGRSLIPDDISTYHQVLTGYDPNSASNPIITRVKRREGGNDHPTESKVKNVWSLHPHAHLQGVFLQTSTFSPSRPLCVASHVKTILSPIIRHAENNLTS